MLLEVVKDAELELATSEDDSRLPLLVDGELVLPAIEDGLLGLVNVLSVGDAEAVELVPAMSEVDDVGLGEAAGEVAGEGLERLDPADA